VSKSHSKTTRIRIRVTKVEDDWIFVAFRMNKGGGEKDTSTIKTIWRGKRRSLPYFASIFFLRSGYLINAKYGS
jgi:hypothetical protein